MEYKVKLLIKDNDEVSDEQVVYHNPRLQNNLIANSDYEGLEGSCYNYALDDYGIPHCEEALYYLIEYYKRISISNAKKGDIITYYYKDEYLKDIQHFVKIIKTNGTLRGTIIRSKWGELGIYETDLYNLPEEYGNIIEIWTKRK